jgi:hypothetical protein
VTVHEFEHPVVALVRLDFERISPPLQEGHFFEARPPGTVVPQHGNYWEPVSARGFEIEPADSLTSPSANGRNFRAADGGSRR